MYRQFYGLNENPFDLTPNPRYLYLSENHREALAKMIYGVTKKKRLHSNYRGSRNRKDDTAPHINQETSG